MPDKYKFRIPIDFTITVPGVTSPNQREKLREECAKVIHNMFRAQPNEVMFDYDVEINGITMRMNCYMGFMGTSHAPSRFRSIDTTSWWNLAHELYLRSKNVYDPAWKRTKKFLKRKADVPFPVGRYAYSMMMWIEKCHYIQFRQMEMLEYWSKVYKTTNKPPQPVGSIKRVKKTMKGLKRATSKGSSTVELSADNGGVEGSIPSPSTIDI